MTLIILIVIPTALLALVTLAIWYFVYRKNPWGAFSGLE